MATYVELSATLLDDAAAFFKTLASQNPLVSRQMAENASVFGQIAERLKDNPHGQINGRTHILTASELLKEAAALFRTLGNQNVPIQEQMEQNAAIFEQVAAKLASDPLGSP